MIDVNLRTFVETLFPDLPPDELPCLARGYFRNGDTSNMMFENIKGVGRTLRKAPGKAAWYVCLSTVRPAKEGDMLRRRHKDLMRAHVIMLDDIGTKAEAPDVEPSYKIETSPLNFQWGYRIHPFDVSSKQDRLHYEACIRSITHAGYGDKEATGAYRVIRVPGSLHLKNNHVSQVTEWHPDRIWELDDLMDALGLQPVHKATKERLNGTAAPDGDAAAWTQQILTGEHLHGPVNRLACHFANRGLDEGAAIEHMRALMGLSARRQADPSSWQARYDDIPRAVRSGYDLVREPDIEESERGERFHMIKAANRELLPLDWAIKDVLEKQATSILFGEPKVGKTFCVLDMCLSIAAGIPYHGLEVTQMPVAYIAGEGQRSLDRRILAWCQARNIDADNLPFFYSSRSTALLDKTRVEVMVEAILEVCPDAGLLVIDTLARNLGGGENDNDDINKMFDVLDHKVTPRFPELTKLIIAHPGHQNKSRPRGGAAILGNSDALMKLEPADGAVTLKCIYMKESENFTPMLFMLNPYGGDNGSLVPDSLDDTRSRMAGDLIAHPNSTVRERAERLGVSKSYVSKILRELEETEK